jgi:hypothetical protein
MCIEWIKEGKTLEFVHAIAAVAEPSSVKVLKGTEPVEEADVELVGILSSPNFDQLAIVYTITNKLANYNYTRSSLLP